MKFRIKFLIIVSTLLIFSCGTKRNLVENTNIKLTTHKYYTTEKKKKLDFDFYRSALYKQDLPLIIYVHGGGFSGGSKDDDYIKNYCIEMAKNGFAVASISYRLTMKKFGFGCNTDTFLKISAFNSASEDISFVSNHFIKNKRKFGINPNIIILVGSSAGAEAILNLAYVYKNKILPKNFKYAGLIAMAGAITTLDNITRETAIPTQFFHGIQDKLVPYNIAPHHYCKESSKGYLTLYGSRAIANKLKQLKQSYHLQAIEDGDHSWNAKPMYLNLKEMLTFIDEQIIQRKVKQIEITKKESDHNSKDL